MKELKKEKVEHEILQVSGVRDYHRWSFKNSSPEQRLKFNIGDIWINALMCKKCEDYIRSKNRHDFKYCKCGTCAIDGGSWYQRILGDEKDYISVREYFDVKHD